MNIVVIGVYGECYAIKQLGSKYKDVVVMDGVVLGLVLKGDSFKVS